MISLVSWLHKNYLTSMSSPLTISGLKPATIINLSTIKYFLALVYDLLDLNYLESPVRLTQEGQRGHKHMSLCKIICLFAT